ncbi:hypothetical protein EBZ37_11475 [bacterium]|nr:hypothetical protein [bacterium]
MDSGSARQSAGVAFILIAIALGLFSIMSAWASRGVRLELERSLEAQDSEEPSMGFESLESPEGTFGIDQAAEGWARARNESLRSREEIGEHARALMQSTSSAIHGSSDPVADFESKIQNAMTLETVEKELVEAAGSLTNGNVIYFRYQRRMQNLSLQIASQAANLGSYASLQAYVRKDIELQVEQLSDSGKVASLTHYAPIKRMIQTHFQGKSFEAWAVTSTPEVSLQAKMVGVLVLIDPQGGASFRPKLARILKEAGNYLFAQGNKIKSRGSQELSDSSLMT